MTSVLEYWEPRAVVRQCRVWVRATHRRRRAAWLFVIAVSMVASTGIAAAVAMAQTDSGAPNASTMDGIAWMEVHDSSGVRLSDYMFVTNTGSVTEPGYATLSVVLGFVFTVFLVVVVTVIWLIGFALGFRWLTMLDQGLSSVADGLTRQLTAPIVLMTAAATGAFFVGCFVVRGHFAKATMQVVTMVGVAVLGVPLMAHPLANVLSANGLMAQGRDLGISVAAGLNGNANPNPSTMVDTLEGTLADNFVRRPVQVWNFGHVVDDVSPRCRAAWSAGVRSRTQETAQRALVDCGDRAAYARARNPEITQVGTGLLLLVFALILLLFGLYLAIKIIGAALDAVYHAFMSIFGFAIGGFIYGPSQTFLVRNLVDVFVQAGRMVAYTIFLGVYVLILGRLFEQARGREMAVIIVAGVIEIVAIDQIRRLSGSLDRGNDWIAGRFASAIAGGKSATAGGGGVLGMGSGADGGLFSAKTLQAANSSIVLQQLLRTASPLLPSAFRKQHAERIGWAEREEGSLHTRLETIRDMQEGARLRRYQRQVQRTAAGNAANAAGGIHTPLGVAAAIQGAIDMQATRADAVSIGRDLGASHQDVRDALRVGQHIEDNRLTSLPARYGRFAMAAQMVERSAKGGRIDEAAFAALQLHSRRLAETMRPVDLDAVAQPGTPLRHQLDMQVASIRMQAQNSALTINDVSDIDPNARKYVINAKMQDSIRAIENYQRVYRNSPAGAELTALVEHIGQMANYSSADF